VASILAGYGGLKIKVKHITASSYTKQAVLLNSFDEFSYLMCSGNFKELAEDLIANHSISRFIKV